MNHLAVNKKFFSFIGTDATLVFEYYFVKEIKYDIHIFTICLAVFINIEYNKINGVPDKVPAFPGSS